jgi:hypothetical protein
MSYSQTNKKILQDEKGVHPEQGIAEIAVLKTCS